MPVSWLKSKSTPAGQLLRRTPSALLLQSESEAVG
jgi:hypothetical protein